MTWGLDVARRIPKHHRRPIGSSPSPLIARLAAPKERGRLLTEPDLRVRTFANVWAIGDCAEIINEFDGKPAAPTGQFAEREGTQCARNIARVLRGRPTRPFSFRPLGQLCSIGGHAAVAEFLGLRLSGFVAWLLWRGVYLFKLPTWARRLHVGLDWAWLLLFPRDLAHLRSRPTDRVTRAHFQAGDTIVHPHATPSGLLVVRSGEVELVDAAGNIVNVLGPGSFLAEQAMLAGEPFGLTARARMPVELLVLGRNVFTQLSASLLPLRDALDATLRRRSFHLWKTRPEVLQLLHATPLRELVDPPPAMLPPASTLDEAGRAFATTDQDYLLVGAADGSLAGIVTMTDLARAASTGASPSTPVADFMTRQPAAVNHDDTSAVAATILRERALKHLPVVERASRRLVGVVHARRLLAHVYRARETQQHAA